MLAFERVEPGFYEVRLDGSLRAYVQRYRSTVNTVGWLLYSDEKPLADVKSLADAKTAAATLIH